MSEHGALEVLVFYNPKGCVTEDGQSAVFDVEANLSSGMCLTDLGPTMADPHNVMNNVYAPVDDFNDALRKIDNTVDINGADGTADLKIASFHAHVIVDPAGRMESMFLQDIKPGMAFGVDDYRRNELFRELSHKRDDVKACELEEGRALAQGYFSDDALADLADYYEIEDREKLAKGLRNFSHSIPAEFRPGKGFAQGYRVTPKNQAFIERFSGLSGPAPQVKEDSGFSL